MAGTCGQCGKKGGHLPGCPALDKGKKSEKGIMKGRKQPRTCIPCKGTGMIGKKTCYRCHGTGEIT